MKVDKREQKIISLLESKGELRLNELSEQLDISLSTLRKNLAVMQEKGLVIRTYGGVMSVNRVPDETFDSKLTKNVQEKQQIAAAARTLLKDDLTIALGSGTTIYTLASLLYDLQSLAVYTNSLPTAEQLARCKTLDVHICGGIIRSHTGTITGSEAREYFSTLSLDYAFISCDAIDSRGVIYSDNLAVATSEQAVLNSAKHKYILCDSSKLGKTAVARISRLEDCDGLITCRASRGISESFRALTEIIYG